MSALTDDPNDPRLTHGVDPEPTTQAPVYLVLSEVERARGFVRPVRRTYIHEACGHSTTMGLELAETYAARPSFYGSTWCTHCSRHLPVGEHGQFVWEDGSKVGS